MRGNVPGSSPIRPSQPVRLMERVVRKVCNVAARNRKMSGQVEKGCERQKRRGDGGPTRKERSGAVKTAN